MRVILISLIVSLLISCKAVAPLFISDADEKAVGLKYHTYLKDSLQSKHKIDSTSKQFRWIDSLGTALAKYQTRTGFTSDDFTFTVVNDTIINAFALPGGYIYIYSGLINKAKTTDQIAGVLAHEIGHVAAQHYKEVMLKSASLEFLTSIIAGENQVSQIAAGYGKYLIEMKTGRMNEYEADSLAVDYLAKSKKLSPWGMKSLLDTLKNLSPALSIEILQTHPNPAKRSDAVSEIIKNSYPEESKIPDTLPKPIF